MLLYARRRQGTSWRRRGFWYFLRLACLCWFVCCSTQGIRTNGPTPFAELTQMGNYRPWQAISNSFALSLRAFVLPFSAATYTKWGGPSSPTASGMQDNFPSRISGPSTWSGRVWTTPPLGAASLWDNPRKVAFLCPCILFGTRTTGHSPASLFYLKYASGRSPLSRLATVPM